MSTATIRDSTAPTPLSRIIADTEKDATPLHELRKGTEKVKGILSNKKGGSKFLLICTISFVFVYYIYRSSSSNSTRSKGQGTSSSTTTTNKQSITTCKKSKTTNRS